MSAILLAHHEHYSAISTAIAEHPYRFALFLIFVSCVITRIKTGVQARYNTVTVAEGASRPVPVVPYWTPLLGHTASFGIWFQDFMKATAYKVPSGIFALKVAGGTHNIVVSPSLTRELLNRPSLPMDNETLIWRFLELPFGDERQFRDWHDRDGEAFSHSSKLLHGLMREPFLSDAIARTVHAVEQQAYNLVSGNTSWVDQAGWERAGQVDVVSLQPKDGKFVAEADLCGLVRHFVGDIATSVLMGRSFLDHNPTFLDDLWTFDSKVGIMMLGLPWWLVPGIPPAIGARERMVKAIQEHHKAMLAIMEGKDPGYKYSDLTDASSLVWDRAKSFRTLPDRTQGVGDLVLVWAMNVNANATIFWMLYFIYSQPDLLAQIRAEIKPYAQLHRPDDSANNLPIKEAPRLTLDINNLVTKCPLLKGTFFETMRHELASNTFRVATEDFTITESKEDALKVGKLHPEKYLIKKNDLICIPYKVHQDDPRYYDRPAEFDARRFWVRKQDETGEEQVSAEYGSMRVWGGGKTMCKGRNFAEREVLAFVAGIVAVWDMEAVGDKGWKHPGNRPTAGTYTPKRDVRVRMWRREL